MMDGLEFHPIANIFPLMEGEEFDQLVEDIRAKGLRERIVLHEGKILDGRNRYRACLATLWDKRMGMDAFVAFDGDDPLAYVISANLHRRHLTTQQRAAIAAELATMKSGTRTDLASNDARSTGMSDAQAAKVMGVSEPSVERAKTRMRTDSEAHAKAKAGTLPRAKPTRRERDGFERARPELKEIKNDFIQERIANTKSQKRHPSLLDGLRALKLSASKLYIHNTNNDREKLEEIIANREHLAPLDIKDAVGELRKLASRVTDLTERLEAPVEAFDREIDDSNVHCIRDAKPPLVPYKDKHGYIHRYQVPDKQRLWRCTVAPRWPRKALRPPL
jgi:transposase